MTVVIYVCDEEFKLDTDDQTATATNMERLYLRVIKTQYDTTNIATFDLADPNRNALPAFSAGAHIDIWISEDECRQYSLCGSPDDAYTYRIGVQREDEGSGGSIWVHDHLRVGEIIEVSSPRNLFPLADDAGSHILLAGGIGVTPLIAMIHELEERSAPYEMHFCSRSADRTPFLEFLTPRIEAGRVHIHHDEGDPAAGLDIAALLHDQPSGAHLYYCGPAGFMSAAKDASSHWAKGTVHFEYFSSPEDDMANDDAVNVPFQVKLKDSGEIFDVPADQTIVEVLRANGIPVDTQCEDGFCATCMTRYVAGEPEHRDSVLDDDDRSQFVLICCARSKTPLLELDL